MANILNILFLSNMMEEKGVWTLLDACRIIKSKGYRFRCRFVGKWSDISENAFQQRVCEAGLSEDVTAYGAKYGEEKQAFWKQADVFVFPTYYHNECFPLVLLEAMEQGVACISTREGGIPDIIEEGRTGYLIERQHVDRLAEKLIYLMEHPEKIREMGEAGREKFRREFTLATFESRMKEILMSLCRKNEEPSASKKKIDIIAKGIL